MRCSLRRLPAGTRARRRDRHRQRRAGLDFDALQMRLHPAASRVAKLAAETPAAFVAFDALAVDGEDVRQLPQVERRARLEKLLTRRAARRFT